MPIEVNDKGYVYDTAQKLWLPPINKRQFELFEDTHRYILVEGCRKSSKTWGLVHKILRHAFDINGAMFAIVNKTLKNAKSSGVWTLMSSWMLPFWEHGLGKNWKEGMPEQWKYGCPGFKVVEGPKTTGDTKLSYVRIRNRHGTISEIQCHSLEHSSEVEAKFKGPFYSGYWCSEADQYLDEHAFHILCDSLRMYGVTYAQHQIILDMNPPDSGPNNWFYEMFFTYRDNPPKDDPGFDPIFHGGLQRLNFTLDDNPQLDPHERRELVARYKKRKTLYDRFILGKWVQDITGGFFSDVYDESIHIVGNVDCPEEERAVLVPTEACTSLITGWDMGESKNHSFHILEKIVNDVEFPDPETGKMMRKAVVSFSVLDELVVIRTYISIREFVLQAMDKMDMFNAYQKKHRNIVLQWHNWSDTSAFRERSAAESSEAAIAYEASGGRIILAAAPKYRDSRRDRVKLIWQFLYEKRLHISAQLRRTKVMLTNLRQGTGSDYIKADDHKHVFDSMSYPIISEAPMEMFVSAELSTAPKEELEKFSGLVMAKI